MKHATGLFAALLAVAITAGQPVRAPAGEASPLLQPERNLPAQPQQQQAAPIPLQQFQDVRQWRGNIQHVNLRDSNRRDAGRSAGQTLALTSGNIRLVIDRATAYMHRSQAEDGSIEENLIHYSQGAGTVMAALAMLAAGADPESDAALMKALDWLKQAQVDNTYFRAVRANVWEYALRRSPDDESLREALREDFDWLMAALGDKEGWRYVMSSTDWDNSVTQYGVLGIWAACRAGLDPGQAFWQRMSRHFRSVQNEDGGWGYTRGGSSANMATAGLATLFLVFDMHHGRQYYQAGQGNPFLEGEAAECLSAISRGMQWLDKNGGDNRDGYYLYGIERTGVASGRKRIGGHDWFKDGAEIVLAAQRADGSIPLRGHGKTLVNTAFATLFMVHGGAPVAFNKLAYGDGERWNLNPRDIANVTRHLWSAYEQPLNWFSVHIDDPADELEAPILSISGAGAVAFTEEQVGKLRRYVERGGLILAEASDHCELFKQSMIELLERLYPAAEYPHRTATVLPATHPVYTVIEHDWQKRPTLRGATMGSRLFFVLSDDYLARDWQMNETAGDAFKLALNLLIYTTDRGSLYPRFHSALPDAPPAARHDKTLRLARWRHSGEWNLSGGLVENFAPFFEHINGYSIEDIGVLDPACPIVAGVDVILLTGSSDTGLSPSDGVALLEWMKAGGTLLVDGFNGQSPFVNYARNWIESEIGHLTPLPETHPLARGRFAGGFDLSEGLRYSLPARRLLRGSGASTTEQHLEAVYFNGRPALLFSRFGLTAPACGMRLFESACYSPAAARKVLSNIFAYLQFAY